MSEIIMIGPSYDQKHSSLLSKEYFAEWKYLVGLQYT